MSHRKLPVRGWRMFYERDVMGIEREQGQCGIMELKELKKKVSRKWSWPTGENVLRNV